MKRDAKNENAATLRLVDPLKKPSPENDAKIDEFCERLRVTL